MLAEVFFQGNWKNFSEIENALTLQEVNLLATAGREREYRNNKFMAALKGIDLDEQREDESDFAAAAHKAAAELAGKSESEMFWDIVGIEFESDEED